MYTVHCARNPENRSSGSAGEGKTDLSGVDRDTVNRQDRTAAKAPTVTALQIDSGKGK
jgi:hypothetical protein